jgi:DNA-binding response OmpR family regulator
MAPLGRLPVLVIEDDREIGLLVQAYFEREGAQARLVGSAEEGFAACAEEAPALVLLDLGLPGADGLEFLRRFRATSLSPVIILSAREADEDKILGLGLGADDFVSKPFSPRVLVARAVALLRRQAYDRSAAGGAGGGLAGGVGPGSPVGGSAVRPPLSFGDFLLDREARLLERKGLRVALAPREFELLEFLALRPGRTFGPEELHREVWGLEHGDLSTVAVHVQRLRRKIEEDPSAPRRIETVPGAGYRFLPDPSPGKASPGKASPGGRP